MSLMDVESLRVTVS